MVSINISQNMVRGLLFRVDSETYVSTILWNFLLEGKTSASQ
jgi:hypothetical protein